MKHTDRREPKLMNESSAALGHDREASVGCLRWA